MLHTWTTMFPSLWFGLVLLAIPTGSAARAEPAGALPQARAETAEERRVLQLSDGRKLRAVSRWREGRWEVRDGATWLILPEGLVGGVQSERELLARMRELSARVPPDDLTRKCALAEWMIEQGLLSEALNALDQILSADPEHAPARALLARGVIPVALPAVAEDAEAAPAARVDALLRFGAQARAALREVVVARLAKAGEPALVRGALVKETTSGVVTRRAFAVLALRRLFPGEALTELVQRAALDPAEDVRHGAALGLRCAALGLGCPKDPRVLVPLVHLLARDAPALRLHAVEALGTMGEFAAVEPLLVHLARVAPQGSSSGGAPRSHLFVGNRVAYLQDFNVEIAQGASIADPIVGEVSEATQLDVRIVGVGVESATPAAERRAICRALARLSGARPSEDPARWFAWWEARQAGLDSREGGEHR